MAVELRFLTEYNCFALHYIRELEFFSDAIEIIPKQLKVVQNNRHGRFQVNSFGNFG